MVFHIEGSRGNGGLSMLYSTVERAKKAMIEADELTEEEAMNLVVPEYLKSPAEILSPLNDPNKEFINHWSVEEFHHYEFPCPYIEQFESECSVDDEDCLVDKQIAQLRSFMGFSVNSALQNQKKIQSFWSHIAKIGKADPPSLEYNAGGNIIILRRL